MQADEPQASVQADKPQASVQSVEPQASVQSVEPQASVQSVEPQASVQSVEPQASVQSVEPQASVQSVEPQASVQSVEPQASVQSVEPQASVQSVEPQASVQSVEPVDKIVNNFHQELSIHAGCSDAAQNFSRKRISENANIREFDPSADSGIGFDHPPAQVWHLISEELPEVNQAVVLINVNEWENAQRTARWLSNWR